MSCRCCYYCNYEWSAFFYGEESNSKYTNTNKYDNVLFTLYYINIINNKGKPHTNINAINIHKPSDKSGFLSESVCLSTNAAITISTMANIIQGNASAPLFDKDKPREYSV